MPSWQHCGWRAQPWTWEPPQKGLARSQKEINVIKSWMIDIDRLIEFNLRKSEENSWRSIFFSVEGTIASFCDCYYKVRLLHGSDLP